MGLVRWFKTWWKESDYELPKRTSSDLKQVTKIVFIDDNKFEVTQILQNAGWINTERVEDVKSLDAAKISEAHIVFVDIRGVGKELKFKDEGLGLIKALRKKYPYKKLVVYSAERTGDRFHKGLSVADERLPKNAEPFQFQTIVDDFSREAFSLNECVRRLQRVLRSEFDIHLSESEIRDNMRQLASRNDVSNDAVARIFNLSNAGSVASIIALFLSPS